MASYPFMRSVMQTIMQSGRFVRQFIVGGICFIVLASTGCHDVTNVDADDNFDPSSVQNARGAAGMYVAARGQFQVALAAYVVASGLLTDELQANSRGAAIINQNQQVDPTVRVDARVLEGTNVGYSDAIYGALQSVRAFTQQAIGALAKYDRDASARRRGLMYALQGYAEIMLADFFCSGVPLSTFDFERDVTYQAGSRTENIYRHAIVLFDTALVLGGDSLIVSYLARVGTARALLAIGQYVAAQDTVRDIPTDFVYSEQIFTCEIQTTQCLSSISEGQARLSLAIDASVADREGGSGASYISSEDPRTVSHMIGSTQRGFPIFFPAKYSVATASSIIVASGIEARLIEAEAQLRSGNTQWLQTLNTLRTSGAVELEYTRTNTPGVSPGPAGVIDTTWSAGTGIGMIPASVLMDVGPMCPGPDPDTGISPICTDTVWYKGLAPLIDPGTDTGRVSLVTRERAMWLFLTGHRQGDLRRSVRDTDPVWRRPKVRAYPAGSYPGLGVYGLSIDAPIPESERQNPQFKGCFSRD